MRDLLKLIFKRVFLDGEKQFLREQVKELQTQIIVLSGKNMEYINTKMANTMIVNSPSSVDPLTGGLKNQIELPKTPEEKKQYDDAQSELREMFGAL